MDSVALVKYRGDGRQSLEEALELLGGFGDLKSPLVVKPNICAMVDETGFAVTDVNLVEAFIRLALEQNEYLTVRIVESDSMSKLALNAFEKFGYSKLAQNLRDLGFDVSLVNLSESPAVPVKLDGLYFRNPKIAKLLTEHMYFVSIAVAKTHGLTLITGTMKNLFGLLQNSAKSSYHPHINDVIVDINRLVRPNLCIIDARTGLEGWAGPKKRHMNAFIVGRNPVSVDATMARVMGFSPKNIRHLVEAQKHGLGSLNPQIFGESLQDTIVKFATPPNLSPTALVDHI